MAVLSNIWGCFFAWMPLSLQIVFFGFVAIAMIVLVIRVVGLVLSAIPLL